MPLFDKIQNIILLILAVGFVMVIGIGYNFDNSFDVIVAEDRHDIPIKVELVGEVANEGVYTVESGSRICDVIYAAGGITNNADISNIKPNAKIIANTTINIPSKDDNSYPTVTLAVNINTANTDELMLVPGIGEITAQNIVDYRKLNGKFKDTSDIMNVKGIGKKKYIEIKEYIITEEIEGIK